MLRGSLITLLLILLWPGNPGAQEQRPLLMEGKQTLFQRVLTRPQAGLHESPGGEQTRRLPPFQPFYVYAREGDWIEVGGEQRAPTSGWVKLQDTMEWKQNIVVAFANPAGRERQLLFDSEESMMRLLNHEAVLAMARRYRKAAEAGEAEEGSGVLSIEPAEYVDISEEFYLLPILDWTEQYHPMTGEPLQLLRVASVPFRDQAIVSKKPSREEALRSYNVGVVFVIDTTQSMQPYIDETRRAVQQLYQTIAGSEIGDRVSFGMIGFRDSTKARPELEYVTREFVPLKPGQEPAAVLAALDRVTAAEASSVGFNEDSIAGVEDAIDAVDWKQQQDPFGGRYVVLITDAGPKNAGDPNARSGLDPEGMRLRANAAGVAVLTLHLLTPPGQPNHSYAEGAYRQLSRFGESAEEHYFPVKQGDPGAFGAQIRMLGERLIHHIEEAMEARLAKEEEAEGGEAGALDDLGLAMQLAYLGRIMQTKAPDVFEAWISSQALEDPRQQAVEVRLLISKNQLSTMQQVLQAILETGETTQSGLAADQFFGQLKGAISSLAQNPENLLTTDFETLGGAFGEFLEDLPYRSRVMEMTEERWINSGIDRRLILDSLRAKLALYERYHDDPDNWISLFDGAPSGETVFPMPFAALP